VYAGRFLSRDRSSPAAISIGTNPTFAGEERRIEAYVLDFDGDVYGEHVALDFTARLHEMIKSADVEGLKAQIARDVERTRELVRG
jgi:riboflavin kinase/FMN adenylyltransferase